MKKTSQLYKMTRIRVGDAAMRGIDNLLAKKCNGVAERHTVEKLERYIISLESQLGIDHPKAKHIEHHIEPEFTMRRLKFAPARISA